TLGGAPHIHLSSSSHSFSCLARLISDRRGSTHSPGFLTGSLARLQHAVVRRMAWSQSTKRLQSVDLLHHSDSPEFRRFRLLPDPVCWRDAWIGQRSCGAGDLRVGSVVEN